MTHLEFPHTLLCPLECMGKKELSYLMPFPDSFQCINPYKMCTRLIPKTPIRTAIRRNKLYAE